MAEYFINWDDGYGFHSNNTVNRTKDGIDKSLKNLYKGIMEQNNDISREEFEKKLDEGLPNEQSKYSHKGYKIYISDFRDKLLDAYDEEQKKKNEEERKRKDNEEKER